MGLKSCQQCRREIFLGLLLYLLHTSELFSILENKLIGYADDSTLIAVVPSPGIRVTVAESLSRDLVKVSERCELWVMKLNASKTMTKTMSLQVMQNASTITRINPSYLGVGYITPTKYLTTNFTSLVSLTPASV